MLAFPPQASEQEAGHGLDIVSPPVSHELSHSTTASKEATSVASSKDSLHQELLRRMQNVGWVLVSSTRERFPVAVLDLFQDEDEVFEVYVYEFGRDACRD